MERLSIIRQIVGTSGKFTECQRSCQTILGEQRNKRRIKQNDYVLRQPMPRHFFLESPSESGSEHPSIVIPSSPLTDRPIQPPPPYPPTSSSPRPTRPLPHRRGTPRPTEQQVGVHGPTCPCHTCLAHHRLPRLVENLAAAENLGILLIIVLEIIALIVQIRLTVQHLQRSLQH